MRKSTKLIAVLSSAAFLSAVTPSFLNGPAFALAASSGWVEENGSFRYYDSDGYVVTDAWKKRGEDWYYLNDEGEIATNEMIEEYYVDETGKKVTNQWISVENDELFDIPEAQDKLWYYFGKDGQSVRSRWQSIDGNWYYFNEDGIMLTGKQTIEDSVYYLGENGVRRTGWIQLSNETDGPTDDTSWYYFEKNGKMVMDELDKKIGGNYYTFVDGVMQTGWYKLPEIPAAAPTATPANAEILSDNSSDNSTDNNAPASIAGYQYYEEDGKRASGWYEIYGAEGISDDDETYRFYFKKGVPLAASAGVQIFTVNSKQYAFNMRGEMQTGKQVITTEDGQTANAYFAEDGVMKTGKQAITDEESGVTEYWYFHTDGSKKGHGFSGIQDNRLYIEGRRQDADAELRYAPAEFNGKQYLVNTSGMIQKASSSSKSSEKPDLGNGFKDVKDANDKVWVVDTQGVIH